MNVTIMIMMFTRNLRLSRSSITELLLRYFRCLNRALLKQKFRLLRTLQFTPSKIEGYTEKFNSLW